MTSSPLLWSLAWRQLSRQKTKMITALLGIAFACVLIFVQLGFEGALYDSARAPYKHLTGELVMVSPNFETMYSTRGFARSRLYRALAVDGVQSVKELRIGRGDWKNPQTLVKRAILIFGVKPDNPAIMFPETSNTHALSALGTVFFDRNSRPEFGLVADLIKKGQNVITELNDKKVVAIKLFKLGTSFTADGNVLCSDSTFLELYPHRFASQLEIGVIKIKPGYSITEVKNKLSKLSGNTVAIRTKEELGEIDKIYWETSTGVAFIFRLGVVVGFVVGVVIVYQILSSDVIDHLPEYATLKAIGYTDNALLAIVGQEAFILSIIGFIPGLIASFFIYDMSNAATGMPITMNLQRAILVFVLTLSMCMISAFVAMRKLKKADPATLF
ncbi:MAG: FtsX-like permease family protein [Candidatus Melainabacteria bacterium]|nr:MAG: FtsX-like permease family protein [Candidatus Melainabacteria bacterium]